MRGLNAKQKLLNIIASIILVVSPLAFAGSVVHAVPELPGTPETPDTPDTPDDPDLPGEDENVGTTDLNIDSESNSDSSENPVSSDSTSSNDNTGSDSTNTSDTSINNDSEVAIDNEADIDNLLEVDAISGGNESDGNTGNGSVASGDATINGSLENDANAINIHDLECSTECDVISLESLESSNSNTGSGSENTSNSELNNADSLEIDNDADIYNFVMFDADSGDNNASLNTGNGTVDTGDSEIVLTAINVANNVNVGVDVFNVFDDQTGDIIIDYNAISDFAYLFSGVGASNDTTGADSTNEASSTVNDSNTILIDNNGNIVNDYYIDADTGDNTTDKNTGDGSITTGDANVAFNLINLLNNVFLGQLLVGVVNIFGTLSGDIVLDGLGTGGNYPYTGSLNAGNTNTGSDSTNDAQSSIDNDTNIDLDNNAEILNNVTLDANTGDNSADKNTESGQITTGDANVNLNVVNIANMTSIGDGGTVWMVLINNLGQWSGQLFGGDSSSGVYSPFFTFNINPDGSLTATNQNTGAGSDNQASTSVDNDTDIQVSNTGNIVNNVTIDANTGGNSASYNTGNGSIQTGDVNIAVNIVNMLNNTFLSGKFALTIVNIFGSFLGDIYQGGVGASNITVGANDSIAITPNGVSGSNQNYGSSTFGVFGAPILGSTVSNAKSETEEESNLILLASENKGGNSFSPIIRFSTDRGLFDDFRLEYLLLPVIIGTLVSLGRRVILREVKTESNKR